MLTEPDMQARYVATALGVIEAELRLTATGPVDRTALFVLVSGATRAAERLADDLAVSGGASNGGRLSSAGAAIPIGGNVIAFRRNG